MKKRITDFSLKHYKLITIIMVLFTLVCGALIPRIKVDTDPENMLSEDEPVRIFHDQTKEDFSLSDIVVVGIVNDKHPNGVFNPDSMSRIYDLTEFAKGLVWEEDGKQVGVIEADIIAPSEVDHIGQGGPGVVKFEWLMKNKPMTEAQALEVRDKALSNPLLKGTLVSEDGKALCLYLPLTSKDMSYHVYQELEKKTATFSGDDEFHITGLPVAEDTFGVEMFIQMAISAPLAMVVIFLLMLFFFRKLILIISPMIVAMVSVISTMGLLIGFGFPVHIMSSMIPIFLMPIAVVDSIHILSEFFDLYTKEKGRKDTAREVMSNLFVPMLYTSLTSAAGFASLALTPIPPVQVFGIFVAIGIMIAWVSTITFIPAYIMMIDEKRLENFGQKAAQGQDKGVLTRLLSRVGRFTFNQARPILLGIAFIVAIAIYGITQIEINDNPVKWFSKEHPIRRADMVLNRHFGGTYMAYLVLEGDEQTTLSEDYLESLWIRLDEKKASLLNEFNSIEPVFSQAGDKQRITAANSESKKAFLDKMIAFADTQATEGPEDEFEAWEELRAFYEVEKERLKVFKRPELLRYMAELQEHLRERGLVGKSNSVADVVRKVYQELSGGAKENYIVPQSLEGVAQCLMQYQNSHKPDDLWHLVTMDYNRANIWLQLTSGDNKDMERVVQAVDSFFAGHKPPVDLKYDWAGLTYINTVWQEKMVWGMLQSFLGSFIIVFIMMAILFRSPLWGLICMVPLTITIVVIYGIIGLIGKDYDMPVAVLSALTLGMAVDFAIHFLERARSSYAQTGNWQASSGIMFGEPARAISRNVLVIAIGFLPLLAAPLIPYKTVGIFLCAIMALSGIVTLMALPAIIRLGEKILFKYGPAPRSVGCNCVFCIVISISVVVLVAMNLHQYWHMGWGRLAWISVVMIPVLALVCGAMSRRQACKRIEEKPIEENKVETK